MANLFFDLDGTLVDTLPGIAQALNEALRASGVPFSYTAKECELLIGRGTDVLVHRALAHLDEPSLFAEVKAAYLPRYEAFQVAGSKPYPGLKETLGKLKGEGHRLFVYTNKPENIAKEVSDHCFGKGFFDALVGIPLGGKVKPDPEAFQKVVMVPYGLDPRRCAYFGDSLTDIQTAHNLGIERMYAVSWGYVEKEKLLKGRPYRLLERPEEIQDVVKGTI